MYRCQSVLFFELRYLVKSVLRLETSILSSYFVSTNLRLTTTKSVVLSFWKSFHPSGNFRILGWRRTFLCSHHLFWMACLWRLEEDEVHFQTSWWEEDTHKQPEHPAVPREAQRCQSQVPSLVKGVSHSRGFCSLLGIALENSALVSSSKQTILSGNLLGPAHHAGQTLGLIRKKPLWSLNKIRSGVSVSLSVTWD